MHDKTLTELSALLRSKQLSATELAQHYLKRIAASSDLNAFVHVDSALTLAQAAHADKLLAQGNASALAGIPIAHKDIFVTRDWRTGTRKVRDICFRACARAATLLHSCLHFVVYSAAPLHDR